MPIYEFFCPKCEFRREQFFHTFAARERAAEADEIRCPECGEPEDPVVSVPSLDIWTPKELFGVESNGPIETKAEYRRLAKEQGLEITGAHRSGDSPVTKPKAPRRSRAAEQVAAQAYAQGMVGETDRYGDGALGHKVQVKRAPVEPPPP